MPFQDDPDAITWRLHLSSARSKVYQILDTDAGRASFWVEEGVERNGAIDFVFTDGERMRGAILKRIPPQHWSVEYYGGSTVTFELEDDGIGGTDLTLTDRGVPTGHRTEVIAGWVSVLMALKAAVDWGVDLRTHDPRRRWDNGYVEN